MEGPAPTPERDRVVRRSGAVFALSLSTAALAVAVGFGMFFAACNDAIEHVLDGFPGTGQSLFSSPDVAPIPIPPSACPYVRLVAAAAENAGAPWHGAFRQSADWQRFSHDLSGPLAALDSALAAAIPRVPGPVAHDFRVTLHDVQIGRVELLAAGSINDYVNRSDVVEGYRSLGHAGALVGNACGVSVAPPLPF